MKEHNKLFMDLNLHLFDGDGAGGGAAAPAEGAAPAEQGKVQAGAEQTQTAEPKPPVDRKAEFEKLIKGEYKDLFDERAQKMIDTRFKHVKSLEAQVEKAKAFDPVVELLASKYGVDGTNIDALVKAIEEDNSYYEEEAMRKGLSVEQLKNIKKLERENAAFKRAEEERVRQDNANRIYAQWDQQSAELKALYPNFDLREECNHPETGSRFLSLLKSGVDVKTSYEVIHKDELIGGAMQYAAQSVQEKTINDIRARGMRPAENGGSGNAAATIRKNDPRTWTKKDRDEIARRVMRGERIEL